MRLRISYRTNSAAYNLLPFDFLTSRCWRSVPWANHKLFPSSRIRPSLRMKHRIFSI
ncbi:hypothetical protein BT96DRAFT_177511 [Gymnopus androsaceus JB14]|uniref:Uncharacterized protein n=1 Tax=Gymnopus androsaceus JB14 TaxID=1447944 RepID=A0A6A4HAP3_9AGAR|nr:hypothetical protein BT96DRAFT_177511 [Gymnopus androsaceus JB14]